MLQDGTRELSREMLTFYRLYNERIMRRFQPHRTSSLTQAEMFLLSIIVHQEEIALSDLVRRAMMSKQQINHILNQLEEKALIRRVRPAENRRIVVLQATDAARALAGDVVADIENTLAELFSSLKDAELSEYLSAIRTINGILERFPTGKGE